MPKGKINKKDLERLRLPASTPASKPAKGHQIKRKQLTHDNDRDYDRKRDKRVKDEEL